MRATHLLSELTVDGRYALRQMRRRPAFTTMVLLALALGVGASVALVSVVYQLLLRPLPYADEARIQVFWMDYDWTGAEYDFLRQRLGVFQQLSAYSTTASTFTASTRGDEGAAVLETVVSSPTLFDVLGVRPMLGRTYDANDDRPGAAPVVVVSYGLWQQELGADPEVIGRSIMLDGKPASVIGVMPKGFYYPVPSLRLWRPLQLDPTSPNYTSGWLTLVARTPQGVAPSLVHGEVKRLARALGGQFTYSAAWDKTKNPSVAPIHEYLLGSVREPLLLLLGAVGLLFLVACANAAALILARMSDRGGEMAVRAALGAGAGRIARQIFAESLVLALGAALLGSALATAGFGVLVSRLPLQGDMSESVAIGWVTFAAAFGLGLVIALLVSAAPMRHLLRGAPGLGVNRERSDEGIRRGALRLHSAIIAIQVSFAVLLVVGATLLIRSVALIREHDPGFDARGVTTYTLVLDPDVMPDARAQFFRDAVARMSALPGVSAAGLTNRLPVRDLGYQSVVGIEGRADLAGPARPNSLYRTASPGFFRAMGMRVIAGRGIDSTDIETAPPVVVITESFAQAMWGGGGGGTGRSAIGKHITDNWNAGPIVRTVIGVLHEPRMTSMTKDGPFAMYVPVEQSRKGGSDVLVVRSSAPTAAVMPSVRRAVAALNARVAIGQSQTMEDAVAVRLAAPLRLRFFFTLFGALALSLGAIGVYGVVSYAVARRRAEVAVRMALGASPGTVARGVMALGLGPVLIGVVVGTLGALAGGKGLSGVLFGIAATDVRSFVVAAAALLAAGAIASIIPALRAARTSPAEALRGG